MILGQPLSHKDGIPIISIEENLVLSDSLCPSEIRSAAENYGCFHLRGDGVRSIRRRLNTATENFHAQTLVAKNRLSAVDSYRGFAVCNQNTGNQYSTFNLIHDVGDERKPLTMFSGQNQWPTWLPGWENEVNDCLIDLRKLSQKILFLLASTFDKESCNTFIQGFHDSALFLKMMEYPERTTEYVGFDTHCDYGGITLISHEDPCGLHVYTRDDDQLAVSELNDSLFVIFGDMMKHWTEGRIHSPPHRVVVHPNQTRRSTVCCYEPNFSYPITVLKEFQKEGMSYQRISYGSYLLSKTFLERFVMFKQKAHYKEV